MLSRRWLIGLVLAVPIVAFGVAEIIQGLDETNTGLDYVIDGAAASAIAGVVLLLLIALAGRLARRNRVLLLLVFKPGLYLTVAIVTCLIVVHAVLATATIYYVESALFGIIHVGVILAIALGAIGGVVAIARSTFAALKKAETIAIGKTVSREDAPRLWQTIEQTAQRLGALRPEHIVLGLDPTFFVTEAAVISLSGKLTGRTLFCSLPFARILSIREFVAVIGHELGHFKGSDTKFSERCYPIYRGTAQSIASLHAAGGHGSGSIALLPALAILSYFLECFSVAENTLSRDRELAADQTGASVSNRTEMASALVKVHAFAAVWNDMQEAAADALKQGRMFINTSKTYADAVVEQSTPAALEGIAGTHLAHPTDSHPPLSVRLNSLGLDLASVSDVALAVPPDEPAIELVDNYETHEQEISDAYQVLLAQRLGISFEVPQASAQSGAATTP
jgi:Zn-dependent protease with chaperone function